LISYPQLLQELLLLRSDKPAIIAIDGVAGSGKTTLAERLRVDLVSCSVVHMDDLYNGWSEPLSSELTQRVITQILKPVINHKLAQYEKYNWYLESFDLISSIPQSDFLILEGVGSGQVAFREFLSKLIWVELDPQLGFERVLARDGEGVRTQMINFLVNQSNHFSSELTQNTADYTISGVP
jgi:dephospho-CoA kinase